MGGWSLASCWCIPVTPLLGHRRYGGPGKGARTGKRTAATRSTFEDTEH